MERKYTSLLQQEVHSNFATWARLGLRASWSLTAWIEAGRRAQTMSRGF